RTCWSSSPTRRPSSPPPRAGRPSPRPRLRPSDRAGPGGELLQVRRGLRDPVLAEHADAVPLQQGGGHALARRGPALEGAVVDPQRAAGRAALLEDRDPRPGLPRRLQRPAGAGEEGLGHVLARGGAHPGRTGEHGLAPGAALDLRGRAGHGKPALDLRAERDEAALGPPAGEQLVVAGLRPPVVPHRPAEQARADEHPPPPALLAARRARSARAEGRRGASRTTGDPRPAGRGARRRLGGASAVRANRGPGAGPGRASRDGRAGRLGRSDTPGPGTHVTVISDNKVVLGQLTNAAPMSRRRRILVLCVCCTSLLMVALDNTIVNVALPALGEDLHAPLSGLQWTMDAYTLTLAGLLILSGSVADRIGRRRVFRTGLLIFTAGSLLCGIAPNLPGLVAFRIVQAVGGSMLNPVALSIITTTFTDPKERAQAIGVWGGVAGISMALGPLTGGVLTETAGWRAIFWINVPIGLLAWVLTGRFVPESKARRPRAIDPVGQLLMITLLVSLTYGIIEAPHAGRAVGLGCGAVAAAALAALVWYESRRPEPLIDVRFFRSAPFSGAAPMAVLGFAALGSFLFLTTLYLQRHRGLTAFEAGLCTLPLALTAFVVAPLAGRLVGTRGPRAPLVVAGVCFAVTGALLTRVTLDTP